MNNKKYENFRYSNAEALENYWQSQNSQINMLEQFVENGGIISQKFNEVTSDFQDTSFKSFNKFIDTQNKLMSYLSLYKNESIMSINEAAPEEQSLDGGLYDNKILKSIDLNDKNSIKRFEINPQKCEKADYSESSLPKHGMIIILGKKDKYVDELNKYLISKGLETDIVSDILDEPQTEKYVSSIKKEITGLIIVANSHYADGENIGYYNFIMSSYYMIKHFSIYIHDRKSKDCLMLFNTFLDGNLGSTGKSEDYAYGSLNGMAKTLAIEFKGMANVKLIDFQPDTDAERYISIIDDELKINDIYTEVGRTIDGSRYYMGADLTPYKPCENICPITEDDVIVVSGGSRGVTASCILELAKKVKCTFVIIGRAEITDENSDDDETIQISELKDMKTLVAKRFKMAGIKGPFVNIEIKARAILAQRDMLKTFDDIRATGNKVVYYSCNVNDAEHTKAVMQTIHKEVGKVTGIVHGAGIVYDSKIWNKDTGNFNKVFNTKYFGLNNLTGNVDKNSLKLLVMFSSISGYFGNDGQIDYAAGNDYLDKCAYYYRNKYPQCRALAINWGAWDGGMMDYLYRKVLTEKGFILIPLNVGANYFVNDFMIGLPSAQIMISHSSRPQE